MARCIEIALRFSLQFLTAHFTVFQKSIKSLGVLLYFFEKLRDLSTDATTPVVASSDRARQSQPDRQTKYFLFLCQLTPI